MLIQGEEPAVEPLEAQGNLAHSLVQLDAALREHAEALQHARVVGALSAKQSAQELRNDRTDLRLASCVLEQLVEPFFFRVDGLGDLNGRHGWQNRDRRQGRRNHYGSTAHPARPLPDPGRLCSNALHQLVDVDFGIGRFNHCLPPSHSLFRPTLEKFNRGSVATALWAVSQWSIQFSETPHSGVATTTDRETKMCTA